MANCNLLFDAQVRPYLARVTREGSSAASFP